MAEKLAALKQKGGMSEKTLWTNPSPSADFAGQNVILSDSMDNYDYLRFYWKVTRTNTDSASILISPSELTGPSPAGPLPSIGCRVTSGSSDTYFRFIQRLDATTIVFSVSIQRSTSGIANSTAIPLKITGCKL